MGLLVPILAYIRAFFLPRHRLGLESVALRQQLAVFKRKQPRPRLNRLDRLFWIILRRWYSGWTDALILVWSNYSCGASIIPEQATQTFLALNAIGLAASVTRLGKE